MSMPAVLAVLDGLDVLKVPYMLVGSFSSSLYGIPRFTRDVDFVVQLADQSMTDLVEVLGPNFRMDPQMSFETVTATSRFILELKDSLFRIELFLLSNDAHDQERFRRRRCVDAFGRKVWVASAEDVIITKLRWSLQGQRAKDVEDVRGVVERQAQRLNWDYVNHWCAGHGTAEILDRIRSSTAGA